MRINLIFHPMAVPSNDDGNGMGKQYAHAYILFLIIIIIYISLKVIGLLTAVAKRLDFRLSV